MASNSKTYKEQYRRLLFSPTEKGIFLEQLAKVVSLGDEVKVRILLDILKKEGKTKLLSVYRENGGESMLHIAAKFNRGSEIIECLIKTCPDLLTTARKESEDHYGQTALHIAVAKGNTDGVETMLSEILNHSQTVKAALLHQLATGTKFSNTVMMGELPLSVAALTFNLEMISILIENGAEMNRQNTKGDTVIHCLIRFAAIYPDQLKYVLITLEFFNRMIKEKCDSKASDAISRMEYDHSDYSYIWFLPNNDALTALQLSASLSQPAIFNCILNLPKVYCFLNSHDGLFDQKHYDVTEIDTIATEKWAQHQKLRQHQLQRHIAPTQADGISKHKFSNKATACSPLEMCRRETRKSVLEMMFDIKSSAAFDFIQISTVRQIIKTKWIYNRRFYYGWMLFHLLFMVTLTVYSVLLADNHSGTVSPASVTATVTVVGLHTNATQKHFLDVFSYIYLVIGVLYFCMELHHMLFRVKSFDPVQLLNVLHNCSYRIILLLFSVCLITEFILSHVLGDYENYTLILALIAGWWFLVFFLRAQKRFSFFTVMIQKVIVGDMLRFSIIIVLALVSFTAGIYMTFHGSGVDNEDLQSYGKMMMLLFKLMLGLGEFEKLYEARRPWLAVTLFIWFVLLTYVLMFNALIAMMSQTCMLVSQNRHVQWRVQQLSVILFFEGVLPEFLTKLVGIEKYVKRFDPNLKQVVDEKRYFLDMTSIQTEYASVEDIYEMNNKQLQTLPFGDNHTHYQDFITTFQQFSTHSNTQKFETDIHPQRTKITVSPAMDENHGKDIQRSPSIRRSESKREKNRVATLHPESPNRADNARSSVRQKKKKSKRRVDPSNDIGFSYDENNSGVNNFYLNHEHLNNISSTPEPLLRPFAANGIAPRHRHVSENGLIDTHIGEQQHQVVKHVQLPMEPVTPSVNRDKNIGSLDIGLISDSYM